MREIHPISASWGNGSSPLGIAIPHLVPLALDVGACSRPKRLSPGIAKVSACFGLGRYGTDNPDDRRSRARFGT